MGINERLSEFVERVRGTRSIENLSAETSLYPALDDLLARCQSGAGRTEVTRCRA